MGTGSNGQGSGGGHGGKGGNPQGNKPSRSGAQFIDFGQEVARFHILTIRYQYSRDRSVNPAANGIGIALDNSLVCRGVPSPNVSGQSKPATDGRN